MKCIADGARRRLENQHNELVWHAWNSVALSRAKRLPQMQSLMIKRRPKRAQTWKEQMFVCRSIAAAYGGVAP